jgi:anti-sigma factor RsiW
LDNAAAETHLEAHLEECAECGARWRQLLDRRADALSAASAESVSDERLQRQRAAVWERIERRPGFWTWKWVPAAAAVCVLAVGIVLLHPPGVTPTPRPLTAQSSPAPLSDAQLFNDVAALSVPEAPRGAAPIEGLFEQQRDTEDEEAIF